MERRGRGLLPLSCKIAARTLGTTSPGHWLKVRTLTSVRLVTNHPRDSVLRRDLYLAIVWSSSHEKAEGLSNNLKEVFRLVHHVLPSETQHAIAIEDE
jgi:hypothetical protein